MRTLVERYKGAILDAAFRGEPQKHGEVPTSVCGLQARKQVRSTVAYASFRQSQARGRGRRSAISPRSRAASTNNAKRQSIPQRVRYLRVANVYADELRLHDIAEIGCTDRELEKTKLESGDLLIVEGNGSVRSIGRVALWDGEIPRCSHQNHLIRARPRNGHLPRFLLLWLLSPNGRALIERAASSSSRLHTLSISKVDGLPVPICHAEEQTQIVRHSKPPSRGSTVSPARLISAHAY